MINKNVFADELIAGMQKELIKSASNQSADGLEKAIDYLNSAYDVFENFGMKTQADKILRIMYKVAHTSKDFIQMPSTIALMDAGMHAQDIYDMDSNPIAKARVNNAFRTLNFSDKDIISLIGKKNFMSSEEARAVASTNRSYDKIWNWLQHPEGVPSSGNLKPGDEFSISSIAGDENNLKGDKYTEGLTTKKMLSNLKNHGSVFNAADDGNDLLNADVSDDSIEVFDKDPDEMDFEDEK